MNVSKVNVADIRINEDNPRGIKEKKFKQLVNSVLVFPRMLEIRPIVVDDRMTALGGNQRARALQHISTLTLPDVKRTLATLADFQRYKDAQRTAVLGFWESFFKNPVIGVVDASSLTDEERDQFIIKDNASSGAWDWDKLANSWDTSKLNDWGLDIWNTEDSYGNSDSAGAADSPETSEKPVESEKKKKLTICITLNDEAQYDQIVAAVELAVADYDVTLR